MYKILKLLYFTICFTIISGYPSLENENVKFVENNERNFDNKETNEFNQSLDKTALINNKDKLENPINNLTNLKFCSEEQGVVNITKEYTTMVNTEITETTTVANNEDIIENSTINSMSEISRSLILSNIEQSVLNNFTEYTTMVNIEVTDTTTIASNKHQNSTYTLTTENNKNLKSHIEISTVSNRSIQPVSVVNNINAVKNINAVYNTEVSTTPKPESDSMGQIINIQLSKSDNTDAINTAGVEILQNISKVCGKLLGKRISFGVPTTLLEFPWTALLVYNTQERYHCGGSLITNQYVLTAAHCVAQEFYELTAVRLGEHDITKEKDCAEDVGGDLICSHTVDVMVNKIIIHHHYSRLSHKNDIALLRLENSIEISRSYYPICLTKGNENAADLRQGTVAGWGATEKTVHSNVLLKAEVPILDISKCREVYRYTKFNDTTELCASGASAIDVCQGDSGGAIFYQSSVGKELYFQVGIISQGVRRCGDSRFLPAVFTKLSAYTKWIENNLDY